MISTKCRITRCSDRFIETKARVSAERQSCIRSCTFHRARKKRFYDVPSNFLIINRRRGLCQHPFPFRLMTFQMQTTRKTKTKSLSITSRLLHFAHTVEAKANCEHKKIMNILFPYIIHCSTSHLFCMCVCVCEDSRHLSFICYRRCAANCVYIPLYISSRVVVVCLFVYL